MGYLSLNTDKSYTEPSDVVKLIYYVCDLSKNPNGLYGENAIMRYNRILDPGSISSQFLDIQNAYPKTFSRRAYHIIYSHDNLGCETLPALYSIGLALTWAHKDYQSIFAIHQNTKHLHLHMVINNIPLFDEVGTLSNHINFLQLENIAYSVLDEYWLYYLSHSTYSKPNVLQMAKDAMAHHSAYVKGDIKRHS